MNTDKINYSIDEAADLIGCGRTTLYGLIKSGDLAVIRIGARTLVPDSELREYQARLVQSAKTQRRRA